MEEKAIPKDGKCLYHCIVYILGKKPQQMRDRMQKEVQEHWKKIAPWDNGEELQEFIRVTEKPTQWGNGYHIALAIHIGKCRSWFTIKASLTTDLGRQEKSTRSCTDNGKTTGTHFDVLFQSRRRGNTNRTLRNRSPTTNGASREEENQKIKGKPGRSNSIRRTAFES